MKNEKVFTLAEGATQRICTRTERSEFVQVSKTTLLLTVHNPRHVALQHNKRKIAFTLAEVLITLGIIGVVAALTIPTLVQNYKKKEYSTRLKKFYSMMSQAIKLSEVDNGPASEWIPVATENDEEGLQKYWDTYFAQYLKNPPKVYSYVNKWNQTQICYVLSDGIKYCIGRPSLGSPFQFGVNVYMKNNFDKATAGVDCFNFLLTKSGKFIPYSWDSQALALNSGLEKGEEKFTEDFTDRKNVLRMCEKDSSFCTQLLYLDGWEFKDDYPHKL